MNLALKLVFFCGIAGTLVINYGDQITTMIDHHVRATEGRNASRETSTANVVNSMEVQRSGDGHYWLDMNVNSQNIHFIVDTGASYITLSLQDAQNLNLNLHESDFTIPVNTAAGQTTMAAVTLDVVSVGVIELYDVKAFVAREGMLSVSLLGMNYLNRLDRFSFKDQKLILEQ
ncbi:MAG: TIGR02281 family clan AA aspartic protease [Kordiimonadaceae bacterium]|nr:TIGR02281 family clan AA aspartic protease [Kordiimonadaceae bacterium]